MKVVILAGGLGTRLAEMTDSIPKPMVPVGGYPMLWHIMNIYAAQGFKEFILALGYRAASVKEYFLNFRAVNADFSIDLASGRLEFVHPHGVDWQVTLVDTGLNTLTGGRIARLRNRLANGTFMLTYGDGVADIDLRALLDFHRRHGRIATVTAVHPGARFGELHIENDVVRSFKEKPQTGEGWINGGFFVMEPEVLDYVEGDDCVLEREPLERLSAADQLRAHRHKGFWQCMDTLRDRNLLNELWEQGRAPWKCW